MRVAIVSDIHGNLTALEAVIADMEHVRPDLVLHAGDLVANGHRPAEVIDRVRDRRWAGVLGNTDQMLWAQEKWAELSTQSPGLRNLLEILFRVIAPTTLELIGTERTAWLRGLPLIHRLENCAIVHASPNDLWQAPGPDAGDDTLVRVYGELAATVVIYGHIHKPFVRRAGDLVVANAGSVGLPYDGDCRASYLVLDQSDVVIRRVEYDVESEISDRLAACYPYGDWFSQMLRAGRYVPAPASPPESGGGDGRRG